MANQVLHASRIGFFTFIVSLVISLMFQFSLDIWVSVVLLVIIITVGILFDIIGTAVTVAQEAPFHAMGADKIKGSKEAIYLLRRADQVANFCNDVVGDIAGTISGSIIAGITLQLAVGQIKNVQDILNALGVAMIAACTVGGKALGKSFAIGQADWIIFNAGKVLSWFKIIDVDLKKDKHKNRSGARKDNRRNG